MTPLKTSQKCAKKQQKTATATAASLKHTHGWKYKSQEKRRQSSNVCYCR
jgi:hypothetical protein